MSEADKKKSVKRRIRDRNCKREREYKRVMALGESKAEFGFLENRDVRLVELYGSGVPTATPHSLNIYE